MKRLVIAVALLAVGSATHAQGTLSTQGLGYPPGQLSTWAASLGGAPGESDALSALNPAAIARLTNAIILMQAEPEYRELNVGGRIQRTNVARFPLFFGGVPIGSRWAVGISASTLLDRTWATSTRDSQVVAPGDTIKETRSQRSDGSISDLRLAVGFEARPWLNLGFGVHALSGRDFLQTLRVFDDTLRFTPDAQGSVVSFGGSALSVGVQTIWTRRLAIGASYRVGGTMKSFVEDDVVGTAKAPNHFGVSVVYLGIAGSSLAVRAARDDWSRLDGLSRNLNIHEGWDIGVGGDAAGPRFMGNGVSLRLGARWRTLPFSPTADAVKEQSFSGGLGMPFAGNRAELHLGVIRAKRTGGAGASPAGATATSESAWTISTGFSVRP